MSEEESKKIQHDYAIMNQAVYSNDPQSILDKYGKNNFIILQEDLDYLIIKDNITDKVNFVIKGTDIANTKGKRIEDLKEDLHIVLNKPESMKRLRRMRNIAKGLIREYGKDNIVITGHSLGGYITAEISNETGTNAVAFNIGSSPKNIRPKINNNLIHFTTNNIKKGILDPLSMTSAGRDFYDKRRVEPKPEVGSGIIKYHTIEHFLPKEKIEKKNNIINKEMETGQKNELELKKIKDMKITPLKKEAKKMGIKGAYKWKKADLEKARSIVIKAMKDRKKEKKEDKKDKEEEGEKVEKEEEGKYDEGAEERRMKEREERLLETQEEIDKEKQLQADDLVDTSIYRGMGAGRGQQILDKIADDRSNKQLAKDAAKNAYNTGKDLVSSKNQQEFERKLVEKGVPVDKIKEYKNLYDKASKHITKAKLEDGSWLVDLTTAFTGPELAVYNEMVKALGLGLDKQDKQNLRDLIDGDFQGSTGDAMKAIGAGLINPEGWGAMITHTAKKRATKVYNDFTDIFSKDDIYANRNKDEQEIQQLIDTRKKKEKSDIEKAKRLARLRGEEYTGPEYREDEKFNKARGGVKLSDYGGQDDTAWYEKVGKFFVDAGLAIQEELFDPLGFIDIATGKPTPKLEKLEKRLKAEDPKAYAQYKSALDKHVKTLRKASVEDKNNEMIEDHKPVARQLGDIMNATLEENAKLLKEGKEPIIPKEKVEMYADYASRLKSGKVSYHNLAQIDYMFNEDTGGKGLPGNLNEKYMQWQLEEENTLRKKGAGDSELNIAADTEASKQVADISKARKDLKEAEEAEHARAIKEAKETYEMVRQEEIDHDNEQTLIKRKEVIHPGFVETATNKPELRPKIVFGNSDLQYSQSAEEVEKEREEINRMLMWKAGNMTEQNDPSSILYKRYRQNEDLRYKQTFAMPRVVKKDRMIPQQFLRYNERIWVPVNPAKNESLPLMRQPERAQAVFNRFEDYRAETSSMREQIANRRNIFAEPNLQGYDGPAIKQDVRGFNRYRNNSYLVN